MTPRPAQQGVNIAIYERDYTAASEVPVRGIKEAPPNPQKVIDRVCLTV